MKVAQKSSVQSLCEQMYRGTKRRGSRPALCGFLCESSRDTAGSSGHCFAGEVLSEGNREENMGIPSQNGKMMLNNGCE